MTNYTVKVTITKYFQRTVDGIMNDVKGKEIMLEEAFAANKLYADAAGAEHVDYNEFFHFTDMADEEIEKLENHDGDNIEIAIKAYDSEGNIYTRSASSINRAYWFWKAYKDETEPAQLDDLFYDTMEGKLVTKEDGRA